MPAENQTAGPGSNFGGTLKDLTQHLEGKPVSGPADEIESEQRRRTHGIDITQRVGNGDRAPVARVIHDRRKKVYRRHQRPLGRQLKDRGVVTGGGVDQDSRVPNTGQMAQDLR
jgi:hypothetical protein